MVDFNVNGKRYTATEIFNILDKKDGNVNNSINKSIWNQLANLEIGEDKKLGNEIKYTINKENAIKSINVYLDKIANNNDAQKELANLLSLDISTVDNNQNGNNTYNSNKDKTPSFAPELEGYQTQPEKLEEKNSKAEKPEVKEYEKPTAKNKVQGFDDSTAIESNLGVCVESNVFQPWQETLIKQTPVPFIQADIARSTNKYEKMMTDSKNRTVTEQTTTKEIYDNGNVKISLDASKYNYTKEKHVNFTYNRAELENFIIENSTSDAPYFSKIDDIRKKSENERTKQESKLLKEFEKMMDSIIAAAEEYGVDPKQIITIIHQECRFNGDSEKVLKSGHGTGYMQITSAPIRDYLGVDCNHTKDSKYGYEMNLLLKSRGFDADKCKTIQARENLASEILRYLKKGGDTEFNIRMGTLILRLQLDKSNGNFARAAQNYNGNTTKYNGVEMRKIYSDQTQKYYKKMEPEAVEYSVESKT